VAEWKSHYIGEAAPKRGRGPKLAILNSVRARFVERVAGGDVVTAFAVREAAQLHLRAAALLARMARRGQCDCGDDGVDAALQLSQHAFGIIGVGGLAEDCVVMYHDCVCAKDKSAAPMQLCDRFRLFACKPKGVLRGRIAVAGALIELGALLGERQPGKGKKLFAPRRLRGKH